jgi:hypothetical protein
VKTKWRLFLLCSTWLDPMADSRAWRMLACGWTLGPDGGHTSGGASRQHPTERPYEPYHSRFSVRIAFRVTHLDGLPRCSIEI